jgi:hypothetical protein
MKVRCRKIVRREFRFSYMSSYIIFLIYRSLSYVLFFQKNDVYETKDIPLQVVDNSTRRQRDLQQTSNSLSVVLSPIISASKEFSAAIATVDGFIQNINTRMENTVFPPINSIIAEIQGVLASFDPIVETFKPFEKIMDPLYQLLKNVQCPEEICKFSCH